MDAKKAGCEPAPPEHGRFAAQISGVEPDLLPASTTQALTGKEGQQKNTKEPRPSVGASALRRTRAQIGRAHV